MKMKPTLPSAVVIQERHIRHGENYRVFRINSHNRQEYIKRFLSPKTTFLRYKSKQVVIGRRTKQINYKGSPLATSRLFFIEGLQEQFPLNDDDNTVQDNKRSSEDAIVRSEADSASSSIASNFYDTPLSFFNLCDNKSNTGQPIPRKITGNYFSNVTPRPSGVVNKNERPLTRNYPPETFPDFHFLFQSDTANFENLVDDSDEERIDESTVEIWSEPADVHVNIKKKEEKEPAYVKALTKSISKIERDVKNIADTIKSSLEEAAQKVHVTFPKQNLVIPAPPQPAQLPQPAASPLPHYNPSNLPVNVVRNSNTLPFVFPRPPAPDRSAARAYSDYLIPSGTVPFFRVPGGFLIVVHGSHQTTPRMHGTFFTANTERLQYQQSQLSVYGTNQTICIILGPNHLSYEELLRTFNVINQSPAFYSPANSGQF